MQDPHFDVFLVSVCGELELAAEQLAPIFAVPPEKMRSVLATLPTRIKQDAAQALAQDYKQRLEAVGAVVELRLAELKLVEPQLQPPAQLQQHAWSPSLSRRTLRSRC